MSECEKHNWTGEMVCMNCGNLYIDGTDVNDLEAEVRRLKAKLAAAEAERGKLRNTLEHVIEYWNRDPNETAMADALWHIINTAEDAIDAARGAGGWKLVPVEPTDEMIDAGADAIDGYRVDVMRAYEAMLAAAGDTP